MHRAWAGAMALVLGSAISTAHAQGSEVSLPSLPPPPTVQGPVAWPAAPAAPSQAFDRETPGTRSPDTTPARRPPPFMINVKAGAALGLRVPLGYAQKWHQGAAVIDFGIAVSRDRRAYLFVPLQLQVNDERMMWTIAVGFQYDAATPTPGFFLTPRISMG